MSVSPQRRKDAQEFIARIRKDNGGISEEHEAYLAANMPDVLESIRSLKMKLGSATKTLATNLYSKETRFLYELVQNAEDNKYTLINNSGPGSPFLGFVLYPDKLVVNSNEDGFTAEDVKAICSTGDSTKTTTHGYIGEKGIGFKSVFKIAKKVHIQSGPFSFSFVYTRDSDEDGLGMVTPLDEKYEDLPEGVRTRMTLTLLHPLDFTQRSQELTSLPDTLLLFLTRLKSIGVCICPSSGDAVSIIYSGCQDPEQRMEKIEKRTSINGGDWSSEIRRFYVNRTLTNDLPYDAARKHTDKATTVLAFPVDPMDRPFIQKQHVFAYLPLRQVGFTFLIQSDFITQASREDVFDSPRNRALLDSVAENFQNMVPYFCEHTTLQYSWMRYLPDDSVSDDFWKELRPKIMTLLKDTPVLRSWSGRLYRPGKLRWLTERFQDKGNQPLLPDLDDEAYLNGNYEHADFAFLQSLDVKVLSIPEFIDRMEQDLKTKNPRIRSSKTNDDWHTRVANLLMEPFKNSGSSRRLSDRVKGLQIIPLIQGKWTQFSLRSEHEDYGVLSSDDDDDYMISPIFYPKIGDHNIPKDLKLKIVDPGPLKNVARTELFSLIGVKRCSPKTVISAIYDKYVWQMYPYPIKILDSFEHLKFLFWYEEEGSTLRNSLSLVIQTIDDETKTVDANAELIYYQSPTDEYGPYQLFKRDSNIPGFNAYHLHQSYQSLLPASASSHGRTWDTWLTEFLRIRRFPRILTETSDDPSAELLYIIENRPEKLLGFLKCFWSSFESHISEKVIKVLKESNVPNEEGGKISLEKSYVPLSRMKALAAKFETSQSMVLRMPAQFKPEEEWPWEFLKRLGVRFADDVDFYLSILKSFSKKHSWYFPIGTDKTVIEIYEGIMKKCVSEEDVSRVQHDFKHYKLIYTPLNLFSCKWVSIDDCVWEGDDWLEVKTRLSKIEGYNGLEHLFKMILKVRNATWEDSIDELRLIKKSQEKYFNVSSIYRFLLRNFENETNFDVLRSEFEKDQLVFVSERNAWYSPSMCIWADIRVCISARIPISTGYLSLQRFFTEMLEVREPDLEMLIQALKDLALARPLAIAEIKQMIAFTSSYNPSRTSLARLLAVNILPVRLENGDVELKNSTAEFAIPDRKEYDKAFRGKAITLDLDLNEVHMSSQFLLGLGLESRFISNVVEENTMVKTSSINRQLTKEFRLKANALFRFAVHYNSVKSKNGDSSLYKALQHATVSLSNEIFKSISLKQGFNIYTTEGIPANFHLEEDLDNLKLFVPAESHRREICYLQQLPRRFFDFLSIANPSAEAILVKIMGCSSLETLGYILEAAGIVEIDGLDDKIALDDIMDVDSEDIQDETYRKHLENTSKDSIQRQNNVPDADVPSHQPHVPSPQYGAFLDNIVNKAEAQAPFFPVKGRRPRKAETVTASIFGPRSPDRDRKVGAAGELYAFEMLSNLGLPNFGLENWKSVIRKEVRASQKHCNLQPWIGSETSDIVYKDNDGMLKDILCCCGYSHLKHTLADDATYYFEVKTTTGSFDAPFYVSNAQFKRMKRMELESNCLDVSEVYILLRVYNLDSSDIDMQAYVDPYKANKDGLLSFQVETWKVQPTPSQPSPGPTMTPRPPRPFFRFMPNPDRAGPRTIVEQVDRTGLS
ncbi:uncharacterized protein K452DRAFT_110481 [Aplosporella prunicola CBS 121167]|uniref:Protein NO VEIN C-terminal domain-containing protein n=1 Tax=Aplosporella prunicola CBS 121167 TaxID=1176127 RepID=A0A6A6B2Z8_9PEZI|nr:uncharacterized protein K452DRAFT_110481 [Aplosporella prunicola CBS 121167]KAF2137387.1 hypothetical protein K452DRAFT_110481 [Aplosporella prunicola CBS 121167]